MTRVFRSTMVRLPLLLAVTAVVCLGQSFFSDSAGYAAKAVTLTGQVSVLRDLQPWAISVGESVKVQERIITGPDGHAVFQVSDGSSFEVFPNSDVVFRKNAPNWLDLLDVLLGKVRVNIEHLGTSPNPNRVITPTAVISVRGTTFDITVDPEDETTLIEVEDGQVEVRHNLLGGNSAILNPGEQMRVYRNVPIAQKMDKGNLARQAMRMVLNAAIILGRSSGPTGIKLPGGGGGGGVGDTGGGPPPPPGPPTAPPPPPPPAPPTGGLPPLP